MKLLTISVLFSFLFLPASAEAQTKDEFTLAKASVVGYKTANRCDGCSGSDGSFAIQVENWVLRLEKPIGDSSYVLVVYEMYRRSLTTDEIGKVMAFKLETPQEWRLKKGCIGESYYKENENWYSRPSTISDFTFVSPKVKAAVKDTFNSLPCYTVSYLPEHPK